MTDLAIGSSDWLGRFDEIAPDFGSETENIRIILCEDTRTIGSNEVLFGHNEIPFAKRPTACTALAVDVATTSDLFDRDDFTDCNAESLNILIQSFSSVAWRKNDTISDAEAMPFIVHVSVPKVLLVKLIAPGVEVSYTGSPVPKAQADRFRQKDGFCETCLTFHGEPWREAARLVPRTRRDASRHWL